MSDNAIGIVAGFVIVVITAMCVFGGLRCQRANVEAFEACVKAGKPPLECSAAIGGPR